MIKLYKFHTNFRGCLYQEKRFVANKSDYERHFFSWLRWCVEYCGNANVKTEGNNHTITFRHGDKRYKAQWVEY